MSATAEVKEQESQIAKLMETEGFRRPQAIRKMTAGTKSVVKSSPVPKKAGKARPAAKLTKVKHAKHAHLSEEKKEAISVLVRKFIGKGVSVEGIIRSSLNDKYGLYIWYGISDGRVINVHPEKMTAEFKDAHSWAVREWKKIWAKRLRREEKAKVKLDVPASLSRWREP